MVFNNKKELVAWVKAVMETDEVTAAYLMLPDHYILIPRSLLKDGKCDYFVCINGDDDSNVFRREEDIKEEDIEIPGIPVRWEEFIGEEYKKHLDNVREELAREEYKKHTDNTGEEFVGEEYERYLDNITEELIIGKVDSFQEQIERLIQEHEVYTLSKVKSLPPAYLCDLHEWFILSEKSYANYEFKLEDIEKNTLPLNFEMENLGEDCFKGSTGVIGFPTHLLLGLVRAGIDREMELIPIGSGARGFGEKTARTYDVVQYDNFLLPNHSLRVHWDKLTVSVNDGEEQMFMENFYWEKFYNEVDELAICMMLYHYNITLNAPYTQGLYDIFMEKFNEKRD